MKYPKIITGASLLGLITLVLPVVSGGGYSLAPISPQVADYLDVQSTLILFILWYGEFAFTLLLSLKVSKSGAFSKIKSVVIILLSVYAIFVHVAITNELLGNSGGLGIGGILFYLSSIASIFASIMLFKENGVNINTEELKNMADKGVAIVKTTAKVATKVTKTAVSEVKKEIDNHRSDTNK